MNALLSLNKLPLSIRAKAMQTAPNVLRPTMRLVPFSLQEAVEDGEFEFLEGKWLKINIQDLEINWWLSFDDDKLIMRSANQMFKEDVCFSANGDDLILIRRA